ncbi:MAG: HAD family hydrolase [Promethearchaeota archaeon]|nr:MAG: HAD family hydrolase [Candidatus Lokiarchaeota archaeon]
MKNQMKIKGIFFDLYGTLLVYGDMKQAWKDWLMAFHDSLLRFGLELPIKEFSGYCHGFFSKETPKAQEDGLTVFERRIQELSQNLGIELNKDEINRVAVSCLNSWHKYISLDKDTIPVLTSLRKDKKIALISNFDYPPHVHDLLSKYKLRDYFDIIIISGEIGLKKPKPDIFFKALKDTGLASREVIHIGDSLDDIKGAMAANITPILIQRKKHEKSEVLTDYQSVEKSFVPNQGYSILKEVKKISELTELLEMDF